MKKCGPYGRQQNAFDAIQREQDKKCMTAGGAKEEKKEHFDEQQMLKDLDNNEEMGET